MAVTYLAVADGVSEILGRFCEVDVKVTGIRLFPIGWPWSTHQFPSQGISQHFSNLRLCFSEFSQLFVDAIFNHELNELWLI